MQAPNELATISNSLRPADFKLAVTYRPTNDIFPDTGNARTHSKKQVQEIVRSIRSFGFANPILVDESSVIIAGHGRLLAAKEMGLLKSLPSKSLISPLPRKKLCG